MTEEQKEEESKINIDLLCYNLNNDLVNLINSYGTVLPISVVYSIFKDVFNQMEKEKERIILNLLEQQSAQSEKVKTVDIPCEITQKQKEDN